MATNTARKNAAQYISQAACVTSHGWAQSEKRTAGEMTELKHAEGPG